ncbi:hypothetical protein BC939DRAFT_493203 [Gamsiella multidivaricata]|uniref:uncharacterized protein n=1 Tax=Gamsiella multidivaricata TaxID=101098 RepID=UPI00221FCDE9|nr:uncharacterized protein BC939DRAFT_493203 [Gamsiella multidivaricata]KAG0366957.1 JmjC domain-containing histone demethylation protein 1 [Gamsiella multidivaricata]KAI7823243.1 hypothetical protein BC939DRAFT_493203 [Gamsiella multidivaricata]
MPNNNNTNYALGLGTIVTQPDARARFQEQETCRLCPEDKPELGTWICCDVCETWYHVRCLKMSLEEFEVIDQYHCADCVPKAGPSTLLRKSSRRTGKINYADLVNGIVSHQDKWRVLLDSHQFLPDKFPRVAGKDLTMNWLRSTGFKTPVIVKQDPDRTTDGLDMKMPPITLSVDDVRDAVGAETPVEVIDVATQAELLDWNMGAWADYFKMEHKERVYNVISLEITGTPLAEQVQRPRVVRELDWVENFWPKTLQPTEFPKVQLYCLMSVKDSFTDFHIDFAGSSVFYHILSGSKIFFFVEPTSTHLRKYAKWSSSSEQSTTFFGDEVPGKCHRVELKQGDTMLIPAGWIHAVYTPSSSVVIGGNFIHSLHVPMQYRVCDIEIETSVSPKFRFPFFEKLNWFVALGSMERGLDYLATLSGTELRGILALTVHLYNRQRSLRRNPQLSKEERHMIKASIPPEASNYNNGGTAVGSLELLRDLNETVCGVLERQQSTADGTVPIIERSLRVLTEQEEQKEQEEEQQRAAEKNKPRIKLRIKLNSTTSLTNSGDEEPNLGEQQVPTSASTAVEPMTGTGAPKLKFRLPVLSCVKTNKRNSNSAKRAGRAKKAKISDPVLYETGSGLDDAGSETELDQQLTSDEEWTEFESQIDEGFDEAKGDDDMEDDMDDDGMMDLRSSDSEYEAGDSRKKSRRHRKGHSKSASTAATTRMNASSTSAAIGAPKPRTMRFSSETVYFGDVDGSPSDHVRPSKVQSDEEKEEEKEEEEEEVVLGLGKKRKLTPLEFSKLITATSTSTSTTASATAAKKKAASGSTAKDRIKSLLMKRR